MSASNLELIHAYRHLLRAGLRAVCFAKPSRYIIRDVLREGFRDKKAVFKPEAVERTIVFLQAARFKGFEHKLLKTLTHVSWDKRHHTTRISWQRVQVDKKKDKPSSIDGKEFEHFNRTLAMLNDSATLCLRI